MMISKYKITQLLQISLLILLFIGCSGSNSPSNTEAITAIKESLKSDIPSQLLNSYSPSSPRSISVKEVKVIESGSVQGEGTEQYWPVKVYASGSYKISVLAVYGSREKEKSYEGEAVYNLSMDGFGVWNAKHDNDFK